MYRANASYSRSAFSSLMNYILFKSKLESAKFQTYLFVLKQIRKVWKKFTIYLKVSRNSVSIGSVQRLL